MSLTLFVWPKPLAGSHRHRPLKRWSVAGVPLDRTMGVVAALCLFGWGYAGSAGLAFGALPEGVELGEGGGISQLAASDAVTRISEIQGGALSSPLLGQTVKVSAIATAFLPGMSGFALQEADADRDSNAQTSEGIFIYYGFALPPGVDAQIVGKRVTLAGTVTEFRGQTQLSSISQVEIGAIEALPVPETITLPVASESVWQRREGMVIEVCGADSQPLVVTDIYEFGRYGNIVLSAGQRQAQFTQNYAPSVERNRAYLQQAKLNRIILDDGISAQNPAEHLGRNGQLLSASNTLRGGDQTRCITGLLDQFQDNRAEHETDYRIQPTITPLFTGPDRVAQVDLQPVVQGSNFTVASVNVLNFFVTKSNATFTVPGTTIVQQGRGADASVTVEGQVLTDEYQRQLDKLVAQLLALDADVYGLNEIQNDGFAANGSIATLVAALNAQAGDGVYAYVGAQGITDGTRALQALGTDAIAVAIIYNTQRVAPEGTAVAPDVARAEYNAFTVAHGNRVPVAQTFRVLALASDDPDALVTVVANHFKSKGSVINGETDQGDGQGANNPSRMLAAQQLSAWLASHPSGFAQAHTVLTGDFNSYSQEDPLRILQEAGYQLQQPGADSYSYSFNGLWGSLDHILTSASLDGKIGGVVKWAVNAEEPMLLDYNYNFKTLAQVSNYYLPDFYRASDHNPVVVGLSLGGAEMGFTEPEPELITQFLLEVPSGSGSTVLRGSLSGGGGACTLAADGVPKLTLPSSLPANVYFPYPLLQWEVQDCAVQSTVTVTLDFPEPVPTNAQYWKWGPTAQDLSPHWFTMPFTRTGAQQIQWQIQDGGLGDSDLEANGRMLDLGGLGVPVATQLPNTPIASVPLSYAWILSGLLVVVTGVGSVSARKFLRRVPCGARRVQTLHKL